MLITLSRRATICQSVAEVQLTGVAPLGAVSHRFNLILILIHVLVIPEFGGAQQILKGRSALGSNDHPIKTNTNTHENIKRFNLYSPTKVVFKVTGSKGSEGSFEIVKLNRRAGNIKSQTSRGGIKAKAGSLATSFPSSNMKLFNSHLYANASYRQ